MPHTINNETDFAPYLRRFSTWKILFLWEAGHLDASDAAERLNLELNDAHWLRNFAMQSAREEAGGHL